MKVLSVNISKKKGTSKKSVSKIDIDFNGISGDAHTGKGNRQVSLLAIESIEKFAKQCGKKFNHGDFAENITTQGIELHKCKILDRFQIGEVELELTQIGKECHGTNCAIFKEVGNCVMPKEGIFCRVIKSGTIKANDEIIYVPKVINISIITLSDRASSGEYEDRSGPKIKEMLESYFLQKNQKVKIENTVIPDDAKTLHELIIQNKENKIDFIFTTGGTGIGERDITIETVTPLLEKQIPGIMEMIRVKYGMEKPNALLSRGVSGVIGKSIIFTLPGSVKAATEYMTEIIKTLEHSLFMLHGIDKH